MKAMKRIACFLLVVLMAAGVFTAGASAATTKTVAASGDTSTAYLTTRVADAATNTVPSTFGSSASDGQVWVDKTVKESTADNTFDVTLSALSQEYHYSGSEISELYDLNAGCACDVLLILDVSASMDYGMSNTSFSSSESRLNLLANAANEAIQTVMNANPNNRIMIYYYHNTGMGEYGELLSLGRYRSKDSTNILSVTSNGSSHTIKLNNVYSLDDEGFKTQKSASKTTGSWTATQYGVSYACEKFISEMNSTSYGSKVRIPYVMLFTDGNPNKYSENYKDVKSGTSNGDENLKNTASVILTSAYESQKITSAYNTANAGKQNPKNLSADELDVHWYNVGIGTSATADGLDDKMHLALDPSKITDADIEKMAKLSSLPSSRTNAEEVAYYMYQLADKKFSENFVVDSSGKSTGIQNYAEYFAYVHNSTQMAAAFKLMTDSVVENSKNDELVILPIKNSTNGVGTDDIFITFTDTIGAGMKLVDGSLSVKLNGTDYTGSLSGGKYSFKNGSTTLDSYAEVSGQTITWYVMSSELPVIKFASRTNPGVKVNSKTYSNADATPVALSYKAELDTTALPVTALANAWTSGSAGTATAVFAPAEKNTYYYGYDRVKGTTTGQLAAKAAVAKGTNTTKTATNVTENAFPSGTGLYTVSLGNNGKISTVTAKIEPSTNEINVGETVTFKITLSNTDSADATVNVAATLDSALTFVNNSTLIDGVGKNGTAPSYTSVSVPKGGTTTITFDATGTTAAETTTTTAEVTQNSTKAKITSANVKIIDLETATVKTHLNNGLSDLDGITGAPAKLYLSKDGTNFTELTKDSTGTYTADVPSGTYGVYNGNTATAAKVNNTSVAVSVGGTNTVDIYWVQPKVITKLDDSNKDIGSIISGATTLYLGNDKTAVNKTATGTYVSATPVFAPASSTDYYIYTSNSTSATAIGKVAVSANGENSVTLEWYTVSFDKAGHGTKPDDQIVKKNASAVTPGNLSDTLYDFLGWYTKTYTEGGSNTAFDFSSAITKKTTVYAGWKLKADVPVKYPEYIENEMPKPDPEEMTVPYNYTIVVKPNVHGTYDGVYTDTSFSATDNVNGYEIDPAVADTGWVFVGYTMDKDDVNKIVTYTAQYLEDEVGNPSDPNEPDGTPDKFQKPVTYKIVNGTWGGTATDPITEYVTLLNSDGRAAAIGSGNLAKTPTNMQANAGYTQNPGKWYDTNSQLTTVPTGYTDTDTTPVTYIYKYLTLDTVKLTYNEYQSYDQSAYKSGVQKDMIYNKTVTLDKKGGTYADNSLTMTENKTVGDPTKEGYTFLGWKFSGSISGDATLTAMWKYNGEYLEYNPGTNPNPGTPIYITSGHKLTVFPMNTGDDTYNYVVSIDAETSVPTLLPSDLTKPGYVFVGWEVTEDEDELTGDPNGDYTAVAHYEVDEIGEDGEQPDGVPDMFQKRVNYVVQNGTWDEFEDRYVAVDSASNWYYTSTMLYEYVTLLDNDGKWSVDGSAYINVPDAENYAIPDAAHCSDAAAWTANIPETVSGVDEVTFYYNFPTPSSYAIVYDANSPDGVTEKETDTKIHGKDLELAGAEREGYTFKGWSKDYTASADAATMVYTENAPATLFAIWQINQYKLIFEGPDGPEEKLVDFGRKLTVDPNGGLYNNTTEKTVTKMPASTKEIADPTREGYTFTDWTYTEDEEGVTLTANWQKDKVVTYDKFIDEDPKDNIPDREPEEDQFVIPYKKILHIDPNGGIYNDTTEITDIPVVEDMIVGTPIAPENKVFVGWEESGPANDGSYTLKAIYADDVNNDGIADDFQNHVTYKVVNGTWQDGTVADKDEWVTLYDQNGKLSTTGTGTATFPEGMKPVDDYIAEGATWSPADNTVTGSKPAAVFTYTFLNAGERTITFDKFVSETELPLEDQITITNETKIITIVPNGGKYNGTKNNTVFKGLTENLVIGKPEAPDGKVFIGWKETSDAKGNLTYIAQYADDVVGDPSDPDNKGDGIPDCFQKRVKFVVLNGTWDGSNAKDKITYVTLLDANGKWNKSGTGKVTFPEGMQPDEYHENDGAWKDRPENDAVTGTDPVSFTYSFDTLKQIDINFNRNVDADNKTPDQKITVIGKTLIIDPNGGEYEGSKKKTVQTGLGTDLDVADAVAPENMIFVGWRLEEQGDDTLVLTAIYKEIKPVAPKTADTAKLGLWATLTAAFAMTAGAALTITRKKHN